jgi:hypothetical protein
MCGVDKPNPLKVCSILKRPRSTKDSNTIIRRRRGGEMTSMLGN